MIGQLEHHFSDLQEQTVTQLNDKQISVRKILNALTMLPIQMRKEYETAIEKKLRTLVEQRSIDELFLHLNPLFSFLDYGLLEYIVRKFCNNKLKQDMTSYGNKIHVFMKQTTVMHLMDYFPGQQEVPLHYSVLKANINENMFTFTLEQLNQLRRKYCCEARLSELVCVIIGIEKSNSFSVSFLVPTDLIPDLILFTSQIDCSFYRVENISLISIDKKRLYDAELKLLDDQFHYLHEWAIEELGQQDVSVQDLSQYLVTQMKEESVLQKDVISVMRNFLHPSTPYTFIDHDILQLIVQRYGSMVLAEDVESYCNTIKIQFKKITVAQLMDYKFIKWLRQIKGGTSIPPLIKNLLVQQEAHSQQLLDLLSEQGSPFKFSKLEIRVNKDVLSLTLDEVYTLLESYCSEIKLNKFSFIDVKGVKESQYTFALVWYFPSVLFESIIVSTNQIHSSFFQKKSLVSLNINRVCLSVKLLSIGSKLKERYRQSQGSPSPVEWIPSPTKKIFRLAMIERERVQRGHIEDRFVQMTISGRIDDILHAKSPVELENIFRKILRGGEVILIEGAPGSGKSTLTVHICQRWGKGELFQQFTVVILVQLRDPAVQRAQTIADLLPVENAQEIAAELIATNGCGVLWILDGWDELQPHLQQESIFRKLLPPKLSEEKLKEIKENAFYTKYVKKGCSREKLWNVYLQNNPQDNRLLSECSVIVTSRPISSGDLHPVVSSRIEVLGFTPEEQRQYFTECLGGDIKALEALLKKIQENPVVQSICYLPLNAAFVVHTFKYKCQSLPNTEYEIYLSVILSCIQRHFEREGRGHDLPKELSSVDDLSRSEAVREPFQFLCELAYRGVMENKVTFSSIDLPQGSNTLSLLQAIESFLQSGKSVFYNFLHLSIQEVLSAYYITTWLSDSEQVSQFQQLFNQPRFAAVFQFYASITKLKSPGIHNVIDGIIYNKSKPLIISLLRCLHEAQDPSLCLFVAERLWYRLDLGGSSLSPLDCLSIGFFLSCITGKEVSIKLFQCYIGDLGAKCLTKFVGSDISKVSINLNDNNIHEEGARMLLFFEHVYLSHNPIGDIGASLISEAVKGAITLKTLVLSCCNFTSRGAEDLSRALAQNSSLEILDITGNSLGDEGISYVAEALKQNKQLKELWIGDCGVTDKGAASLASALSINNSLKMLHMGGDKGTLTEHGLLTITQSLANKREFVKLTISQDFECISDHLTHEVNEARRRNGLLPIEIIGEYHVLDCAMGVK